MVVAMPGTWQGRHRLAYFSCFALLALVLSATTRFFVCCANAQTSGTPNSPSYCETHAVLPANSTFRRAYSQSPPLSAYQADHFCEWIIEGEPGTQIVLDFGQIETECVYDVVYIYDGNSYSSSLLGALSGESVTTPFLSSSNKMMVYFYSDANYVLGGFSFEYAAFPAAEARAVALNRTCTETCLSKGGSCEVGVGCICPESSSGTCWEPHGAEGSVSGKGLGWRHLSAFVRGAGEGYAGHSVDYAAAADEMVVVGGLALDDAVPGTRIFSFAQRNWTFLDANADTHDHPPTRYLHASWTAGGGDTVFVTGGIDTTDAVSQFRLALSSHNPSKHLSDLWKLHVPTRTWTLLSNPGNVAPARAGHTATRISDSEVFIIGGRQHLEEFTADVIVYNMEANSWSSFLPTFLSSGSRILPSFHAAVFHNASRSIYIIGGYIPVHASFASRSNRVAALNVDDRTIRFIGYYSGYGRALFRAVLVSDRILLTGGYRHQHGQDEECHANDITVFDLTCGLPSQQLATWPDGRYGHGAILRGSQLVVHGGFTGRALSDTLVLNVDEALCHNLTTSDCGDVVGCATCSAPANSSLPATCTEATLEGALSDTPCSQCAGRCSRYSSCGECAADGQCHWCQAPGAAGVVTSCLPMTSNATASANTTTCVAAFNQCFPSPAFSTVDSIGSGGSDGSDGSGAGGLEDPGTSLKPDLGLSHFFGRGKWELSGIPNVVSGSIVYDVSTVDTFSYTAAFTYPRHSVVLATIRANASGEYTFAAKFHDVTGFLFVWPAESLSWDAVGTSMINATAANTSVIASLFSSRATRDTEIQAAANLTAGSLYRIALKESARGGVIASTFLKWKPPAEDRLRLIDAMLDEVYQFSAPSCDYSLCSSCFADAACAWCDGACQSRNTSMASSTCTNTVLDRDHCPSCSSYVTCHACTNAPDVECQWDPSFQACRTLSQVINDVDGGEDEDLYIADGEFCPVACSERQGCGECFGDTTGRRTCGFCASTGQCYHWLSFTALHSFGQCLEWVRVINGEPRCPECSSASLCSECTEILGCGWCGHPEFESLGHCGHGDASGRFFLATDDNTTIVSGGSCEVVDPMDFLPDPTTTTATTTATTTTATTTNATTSMMGDTTSAAGNATTSTTMPSSTTTAENMTSTVSITMTSTATTTAATTTTAMITTTTAMPMMMPTTMLPPNVTGLVPEDGVYFYSTCPKPNECRLQIDECGGNATCVDTDESYMCVCRAPYTYPEGVMGPSAESYDCVPDCTQGCENGECTAPNVCRCNVGYYGPACEHDCGCNGNAVCAVDAMSNNVTFGVCNECLFNTEGEFCERCKPGYYGNPLRGIPCTPCECNGRGDPSRGLCHRETGICYCTGYFQGRECATCLNGFVKSGEVCLSTCEIYAHPRTGRHTHRAVLTEPRGGLTTEARQTSDRGNANCVWLIKAPANHSIALELSLLSTECTYDYVWVYDGANVHTATQLAAANGIFDAPPTFVSHTGELYVRVYYDDNFSLRGVSGTYRIEECPFNCSGHGKCDPRGTSVCVCDKGWSGHGCEVENCPDNCLASAGRGVCASDGSGCLCADGYGGMNCNVTTGMPDNVRGVWAEVNILGGESLPSRAGHTSVFDPATNLLWVFGGYGRGQYLTDVWSLNLTSNTWAKRMTVLATTTPSSTSTALPTTVAPASTASANATGTPATMAPTVLRGRSMHTSVLAVRESGSGLAPATVTTTTMIVFGGSTAAGEFTNELWELDLTSLTWQLVDGMPAHEGAVPPPLSGHVAAVVGNIMYVFGGISGQDELNSNLYKYDVNAQTWHFVNAGWSAAPFGVWRASLVHDAARDQLILYGGISNYGLTASVYAFNIAEEGWVAIRNESFFCGSASTEECTFALAEHSAAVMGDYMYVFGGRQFVHSRNNYCQGDLLRVFDLQCLVWLGDVSEGADTLAVPARRRDATLVASPAGNALYVVGGESSTALGDVHAYYPPPRGDFCAAHGTATTSDRCLSDPSCELQEVEVEVASGENGDEHTLVNVTTCIAATNRQCYSPECSTYAGSSRTCAFCLSASMANTPESRSCQFCPAASSSCLPVGAEMNADCDTEVSADMQTCGECSHHLTCHDCNADPNCGFVSLVGLGGQLVCADIGSSTYDAGVPASCQTPCSELQTCGECSDQSGCNWCPSLGICTTAFERVTDMSFGQCQVYSLSTPSSLPCEQTDCTQFTDCGDCLSVVECGWCGSAEDEFGRGVCISGAPGGPGLYEDLPSGIAGEGRCGGPISFDAINATTVAPPTAATTTAVTTTGAATTGTTASTAEATSPGPAQPNTTVAAPTMQDTFNSSVYYGFSCPAGNPCLLGTSLCRGVAACVLEGKVLTSDLGYRCECPEGYGLSGDGFGCEALCPNSGCVNGACSAPDVCSCYQGWYGDDCSLDCGCNGHCECSSPTNRTQCLDNTRGENCTECIENAFGTAVDNQTCVTCLAACNGQSEHCTLVDESNPAGDIFCHNCSEPTTGQYCHECKPGYFVDPVILRAARAASVAPLSYIVENADVFSRCVPCFCNHHGTECDPITGESCNCTGFTQTLISDCRPATYGSCYHAQCGRCERTAPAGDNGLVYPVNGTGLNGEQCYILSTAGVGVPVRLNAGEVRSFLITPTYTNLDLRITLDVDVETAATFMLHITNSSATSVVPSTSSSARAARKTAYFPKTATSALTGVMLPPESNIISSTRVTGKSVVVLDYHRYDFFTNHYYVVVENRGDVAGYARYHFSQPVVTIDLFVFFTVFFCAFFLFASCVVVGTRLQRRRDERANAVQEELHMQSLQSRPLGKVYALLVPPVVTGNQAVGIAEAISQEKICTTPISQQSLRGEQTVIVGTLIDLPSPSAHRNLTIGVAWMAAAIPNGNTTTHAAKEKPRRRRIQTSAL